jgi:hypothetical protein
VLPNGSSTAATRSDAAGRRRQAAWSCNSTTATPTGVSCISTSTDALTEVASRQLRGWLGRLARPDFSDLANRRDQLLEALRQKDASHPVPQPLA